MQTISPETLKQRLDNGDPLVLIDVREDWEYQTCHIEGSRHVPMSQVMGQLDSLDKAAETVFICHHGMRSQQVAQYLETQGFSRVYNLEGGIDQWAKTVDPDMEQY